MRQSRNHRQLHTRNHPAQEEPLHDLPREQMCRDVRLAPDGRNARLVADGRDARLAADGRDLPETERRRDLPETQRAWSAHGLERFHLEDNSPGFWIRERHVSYLTLCAAALFIAVLVLLLTCFSAMTYDSASKKLDQAQAAKQQSQEYYAAESTATEIISAFYQERRDTSANLNGRTIYAADQGDIEVTKIDNVIYFSVPAGAGQQLNVEAKTTKKQVSIRKWQLSKDM